MSDLTATTHRPDLWNLDNITTLCAGCDGGWPCDHAGHTGFYVGDAVDDEDGWVCATDCPHPAHDGRSTPCSNYTARSWSPGSEQPEDARCVNCNQSHGPAVGGSESRVAPGQLADEERSAPPTDLGLDSGRSSE